MPFYMSRGITRVNNGNYGINIDKRYLYVKLFRLSRHAAQVYCREDFIPVKVYLLLIAISHDIIDKVNESQRLLLELHFGN